MAPSWTAAPSPRPGGPPDAVPVSANVAVLAAGLLLLALSTSATAAVVRGPREEPSPLALLVLRAVGGGGGLGDGVGPVAAQLEDVVDYRRAPPIQTVDGDLADTMFLRAAKRQVRYHQCYFNPISCFG
ncbi:Allatostatin [Frankliniella fusca]|uniref:Allatostatin n=1 Tax=Frankliniella fusca TaxID=407009 RepID=A0AAE1I062_9NEOP|nr:Allatostatin [Frankliniella fusca]